jgi:hypothetical protein
VKVKVIAMTEHANRVSIFIPAVDAPKVVVDSLEGFGDVEGGSEGLVEVWVLVVGTVVERVSVVEELAVVD